MTDELITVKEAAALAGVSKSVIYHALGRGLALIRWNPHRVWRGDVLRWKEARAR